MAASLDARSVSDAIVSSSSSTSFTGGAVAKRCKVCAGEVDDLLPVSGLADNCDLRPGCQQGAQAIAGMHAVIDNKHSNLLGHQHALRWRD